MFQIASLVRNTYSESDKVLDGIMKIYVSLQNSSLFYKSFSAGLRKIIRKEKWTKAPCNSDGMKKQFVSYFLLYRPKKIVLNTCILFILTELTDQILKTCKLNSLYSGFLESYWIHISSLAKQFKHHLIESRRQVSN